MGVLIPVAPDEVATVVTTLEMRERPRPRPMAASPLRLQRWERPAPERYRALFRRVGAPWLWYSRLAMTDGALVAIVHDPAVEVFAVIDPRGIEVGMLELDRRSPGACELSYVALVPELTGQGHGRWLMAHALALAWAKGIERVWVHTCTLDHPRALGFYRASGFVPIKRTVETFPDPRALGLLPEDAAPQIAYLAASR
jgi:GNAT superfamily N-acetyltransferase